jgi:hypothetical protein
MAFWRRSPASASLDEFVGDGEERAATPLDLSPKSKDWQKRLGVLAKTATPPTASDLALTAFSLVRGGDLFERPKKKKERTPPKLVETYASEQLRIERNGVARDVEDTATRGVLRVLAGNPAIAKRMLIARPVKVVLVPKDRDFREYGFPRNTNPHAAGVFWNGPKDETALLALREERVLEKPWLMIHEMVHAVHFLAFTEKERAELDRMLLPVYLSRRWVEEAVAIYAERAFGAVYDERDLDAPGLYGKMRREWNAQHLFAKFIEELLL